MVLLSAFAYVAWSIDSVRYDEDLRRDFIKEVGHEP